MSEQDVMALVMSAERRWVDNWVAGPTLEGVPIRHGQVAARAGTHRRRWVARKIQSPLEGPASVGHAVATPRCGCGVERIERLRDEYDTYMSSGLNVVVVAPAEIERVIAYKERDKLSAPPVLADPRFPLLSGRSRGV